MTKKIETQVRRKAIFGVFNEIKYCIDNKNRNVNIISPPKVTSKYTHIIMFINCTIFTRKAL